MTPDDTRSGAESAEALFDAVYDELKRVARRQLQREGANATLSTTELVHEAFLKLAPGLDAGWESRAHFFGSAARAMRQVMVDFARRRRAGKRSGQPVSLSNAEIGLDVELDDMLALDAALDQLDAVDERLRRVVELRFFAGVPEHEIAQMLGVSTRTIERDWLKARVFLLHALEEGPPS